MDTTPNKVTILRQFGSSNAYTVVSAVEHPEKLTVAETLTYDEMLGYVARLLCPAFSDGNPIRSWGRPLFLEPPEKPEPEPKHPDAAGDKAPPAATRKDGLSRETAVHDAIVRTRRMTEYHTQGRVVGKDGRLLWIYDLYPTKRKCIRNTTYSGPGLQLDSEEWTLDGIHAAVVRAAEDIPF